MEQKRMLGISNNHGNGRKISDNIESKIRLQDENANSDSNMIDLYPYFWQTKYQPNFFQCTYASAWTWCVVRYHFRIAQVLNIEGQGNRIRKNNKWVHFLPDYISIGLV